MSLDYGVNAALSDSERTLSEAPSSLRVRDSICDYDADEWNAALPDTEPQLRHDFLLAAQSSGMMHAPRYLSVSRGGRIAGVAVVFESNIDLLTLAAPSLKQWAARVRKGPLKRLGILRAHTCGPIITNCRPNLALAPWLEGAARADVARELAEAIEGLPGAGLRLFFELPDESVAEFGSALQECGFVQAESLPGTRIAIEDDWTCLDDYTGAMRKTYRRAVRDDQERGAALDIRIESDFGHLAEEAHALYSQVLARAEATFEELTPAFFRALGNCECARLVTARERESGKLVGIELLMETPAGVQDLYTGVDYAVNDTYNVYFNLIYPAIALACEHGLSHVSTGQTSYKFKSRLGVQGFALSLFIKHHNPLINFLLRRLHPVICPHVEVVPHRVFKSQAHHVDTPSRKGAVGVG